MIHPGEETILVRYGEIGLKGKNRALFENRLMNNLGAAAPRGSVARIHRRQGRLYVDLLPDADSEDAIAHMSRVFGVVSLSPALVTPLEDAAMERAAISAAREAVASLETSAAISPSFKVEARRANKGYAKTSPEINTWLGGVILDAVSGLSVDVHEPDIRIVVEIRSDAAYVLGRTIRGPGGLPVGSAGRGLALMSGGIDSPVAAWQLMKRGLSVEAIHFHTPPFTGPRARRKVEELGSILAPWGIGFTLHMCHFTEAATAIRENCPRRLHLTIMRRIMLRQASALAQSRGIPVLLTGDSLGQVASQTLENLVATDDAATIPVLRPLIGLDKEEIMQRSREIGSYETSILPHEDCCSVFVPSDPQTTPSIEKVRSAESALPDFLLGDAPPRVDTLVFDQSGTRTT